MKIYIGSDHNGFELKEKLKDYLKEEGYEVVDKGDEQLQPDDDFPMYAAQVATAILAEPEGKGILLCGSGQGVCMAANRYKGIRASLVWDQDEAHSSRNDDDANIICLPARKIDFITARQLVDTWLNTHFAGAPRFSRRIKQLDELN
jgi:ribose 5-phosphate isomerase B